MKAEEKAPNSSIGILSGPCPHTLDVSVFTLFIAEKKSSMLSGTAHVRVVDPPPQLPTKNHTEPRCPTTHFSPVPSRSGFSDTGIERAHCHHSALSWL